MAPNFTTEAGAVNGELAASFVVDEDPPSSNTGGSIFVRRLLAWGFDTIYWFCRVSAADLLSFRRRLAAGDLPALSELQDRGVQGYEFCLRLEPGLRLLVAPESNVAMGLYFMAGPRWLRARAASEYEFELSRILAGLGFELVELRLSRVDLAADVEGAMPQVGPGEVVSRGRSRSFHFDGEVFTGFSVGKGSVRFRLYDKMAELWREGAEGQDYPFWQQLWALDNGVAERETIWRAEWQLRREFLSEFGVSTMADCLRVAGDLVHYLVGWVHVAGPAGGVDHARPLVPFWRQLVELLTELGMSTVGRVRHVELRRPRLRELQRQAVGLVATAACCLGLRHRQSRGPVGVPVVLQWILEGCREPDFAVILGERWQRVQLQVMA